MKIYTKFSIACSLLILIVLPEQVFSQHYADLPANNQKTTSVKKIKKSIVSFGFFSPLNQHLTIGYDQLLGSDIILSAQLGIIGPSITTTTNPSRGVFFEAGPKFFFSPTWTTDGMRRVNAMQGGYFKPEVILSMFSQDYPYSSYASGTLTQITNTYQYAGLALMLNLGHQWIFANSFSLDMYVGIGYSVSLNGSGSGNINNFNTEPSTGNYFSYLTGGTSFPIAFTAGVNIGIPF